MATIAKKSVTSGGYTHTLVVRLVSQDTTANTSRIEYEYYIDRLTDRTSGAWTTLNSVDFTTTVDGTTTTVSPNFDFRGETRITFIRGFKTVSHSDEGLKTVAFSFACSGLEPSPFLLPASGSSSLVLDSISRGARITEVTPNPANEGTQVFVGVSIINPAYDTTLRWETETDSDTIGTVPGDTGFGPVLAGFNWTVPTGFLGSAERVDVTLTLESYDGATLVGTDQRDMVVRQPLELPTVGDGTPFDFRIRRTELDGGDWIKREVIPVLSASFTDTFSASAACTLTISKRIYDQDLDRTAVAIEVFDGAQWLDFDHRMLLTRAEGDKTEASDTITYSGVSFLEFIFSKGQMPADRAFTDTTPGDLLVGVLQAAQNRGWGPYVDFDYTAAKTSYGTPWANTDVSMELKADTPYSQILEGLVEDALAEYRVEVIGGVPTLRMFNPGTGFDWTSANSEVVVNLGLAALTRVADKAPVRKDYSNMLTRVRVRGDEGVRTRERADEVDPLLGHLEGSVSATDVTSNAQLDKLGDAALTNQGTADIERTFSYDISSNLTPSHILPYRVFRPGDWVLMPDEDGPVRTRVAQISLTKDGNTVKATVTGGDLIPSAVAAQARKLTQQGAGAIPGGSLRAPNTLASAVPAGPDNLAATTDGFWTEGGQPQAGVELTWDEVLVSLDGTALDVDLYEVWTRPTIGQPWVLAGLSSELTFTVSPLPINTDADYRVRGRSVDGVYGEWSDIVTVTTPAPDETLSAPSAPVLTSDAVGTVAVSWDGLLGGSAPPAQFAYLQAQISSTEVGGYSVAGSQLTSAGTITVPGVGSGDWWFRLVAYDTLGVASTASTAVMVTVAVVLGDDRQPKVPTGLAVSTEGYWTGAQPEARLLADWDAVTQATDDSPMDAVLYEVWGRLDGDVNPRLLTASEATDAAYAPIAPLGATWHISVRAMGPNNVWSDLSAEQSVVVAVPDLALDPPTEPLVSTWQGLLLVSWDGNLLGLDEFDEPFAYPAPSYLANVDIEVSADGGTSYERVGFLTSGERTQSVSGLAVGESVLVRLVAVDRLGQATAASTDASATVVGIDGADIIAGTITGNRISAGTIEVVNLSPSVGEDLDISANGTVSIIVGDVAAVQGNLDNTAEELFQLRQRYDFTEEELLISKAESAFAVAITNDQMEFREAGTAKAFLNAGVFNAPEMASIKLVVGSHVIEDEPGVGTVIRRV